jgi:hypothetical protein
VGEAAKCLSPHPHPKNKKENIMSYMMFLYQGLTILGKRVDEVTFPEAESSKERWMESPRALQPVENKEGKSAFALVELIGLSL